MRARILAFAIALACSLPVRADVAPFPVWRVVVNGVMHAALQVGDTVYLAGAFDRIGKAVAPFEAILDPLTLSLSSVSGCATDAGGPLIPRAQPSGYVVPGAGVSDAAGPFDTRAVAFVRIGADCRIDRRFRPALPGYVEIISVVDASAGVMASLVYWPSRPTVGASDGIPVVVQHDALTGALVRYWLTPQALRLRHALPDGRVLAMSQEGPTGGYLEPVPIHLGWFDPTSGQFAVGRTVGGLGAGLTVAGRVALVTTYARYTSANLLLDVETLQPLPQAPTLSGAVTAIAAGGGRLFVGGSGLTAAPAPSPTLIAMDEMTGAPVAGWTPPAWALGGYVSSLTVAGSRLLVSGQFAADAPRDTVAAFDVQTGALDPWTFPFVVSSVAAHRGRLYLGTVQASARVARDGLAAVDVVTGDLLPWQAAIPPCQVPCATVPRITVLASDGVFLYTGRFGEVRRYDLGTGTPDPAWGLELDHPGAPALDSSGAVIGFSNGNVSSIVVDAGRIFVTGTFAQVRPLGTTEWQPREAGAAVTTDGQLTAWRPKLTPLCNGSACIRQVVVAGGLAFLQGELRPLDAPGELPRAILAVTLDTGATVSALPTDVQATAIAAEEPAVFTTLTRVTEISLNRIDSGLLVTRLAVLPDAPPGRLRLAARVGRLYVTGEQERDAASGLATGNPARWTNPVAGDAGLMNVGTYGEAIEWHPEVAPRAPGAPIGLTASLNGPAVSLRWSPAAGDLQWLAVPEPPGATAATSYVVTASVTPSGPLVARLETGSPDTLFAVTAPPGVFFVRVQARNQFGTSPPSDEVRVEVRPSAPDPPLATFATVTGSAVRIAWQGPPLGWPATGYLLEAGRAPGASDIGVVPVSGLEFRVSGVPPGRYHVRVRALNANGVGAASEEVVVEVS